MAAAERSSSRRDDAGDSLSVDRLVSEASRATGLDDFGHPSALDALDRLSASLREEADLSAMGVAVMGSMLVDLLVTRLRVLAWAADSDVVEYEIVDGPLIVCGLPRTGTTMLSDLLAQDPGNRPLLTWEAASIAPPPTLERRNSDPRLLRALERDRARDEGAPHLPSMHPMAADRATECVQVLAAAFASLQFETMARLPTYGAWLAQTDMVEAYRFHHLALRVLQTTIPVERWSLKSPAHLWHLDALRTVYPDARLIVTHRDPANVVPSLASLVTALRSLSADHVDPAMVGDEWRQKCLHAVEIGAAQLQHWPVAQVFHLPYAELTDDPVGSIERAYQALGIPMSNLARRRMMAWSDQHPRDLHGMHRYSADQFGLDPAALRDEFADYMRTFEVPTEY